MDVVANAGSVAGFVVITEDKDFIALALGYLKDERDEVALGMVGFAILFGSTAGIKVAKEDAFNIVNLSTPFKDVFAEVFRFPINTFRKLRQGFVHWHALGSSVGSAGGGEYKFFAAGFHHGGHEVERSTNVIFEEGHGFFHGFANFDVGGEVDDGFGAFGEQGGLDVVFVP